MSVRKRRHRWLDQLVVRLRRAAKDFPPNGNSPQISGSAVGLGLGSGNQVTYHRLR